MADQDQQIHGSQIAESQVQLTQASRDAISFQNSDANQITIHNTILGLFGSSRSASVDWDWGRRLLEQKQLPEIRKRLIDTVGHDRSFLSIGLDEQLAWVGRSPLSAKRRLQVQGEDRGAIEMHQLLIATFGRDDIAGKLLILGTPGAGKTTALLSLAEQLVCGALAQPQTVIPVLFELSTWRNDQQSIRDWLIEQLYDLHGGNRKARLYEQWLDQQVLLPLLDGLDELGLERQKQCTLKLNEFARQYPKLVVCCRVKEFEQVDIKLNQLNGAVCLEPLSDAQIQTYLETIQRPQLWSAIQSNPALHHLLEPTDAGDPGLLRVPLFVTLAASVYDPQHPFQTKTELLEQFIDRQLSKDVREGDRRKEIERRDWAYKTPALEPDRQTTQRTLHWIARQLQQNNTVELLIERIQPSWLETQRIRRRYRLIVGLSLGLISGLLGLIFGLSGELHNIQPVEAFKIPIWHGMRREIVESLKRWLRDGLRGGLVGGLVGGPLFGLFGWLFGVLIGEPILLLGWLIGCLILGLILGLIVGLILGLILGLLSWLIVELIGGLIGGLKQDLQLRLRPNQGIWNSLQNSLWTTVLSYPFAILFTFGMTRFLGSGTQGTSQGESGWMILISLWAALPLFLALILGLYIGGGLACVQHVCLRFVLWQSGVAPWNLARFLNYCVERRLLQRVGGRYRFLHRELLDYFAR